MKLDATAGDIQRRAAENNETLAQQVRSIVLRGEGPGSYRDELVERVRSGSRHEHECLGRARREVVRTAALPQRLAPGRTDVEKVSLLLLHERRFGHRVTPVLNP